MYIQLAIKKEKITLAFMKDKKIIDKKQWVDHNDLLEKFFPTLDTMLAQHNIDITDVKCCDLITHIPQGYTTERIAQTIIKTLNFALDADL